MARRGPACFDADVFERFSESAREVVVLAAEEARERGHDHIATEHLLVGLLRVEDEAVLAALGDIDAAAVRARLPAAGKRRATGQIPFTPEAKKVLEHGLREALSQRSPSIRPIHLLLAMTRDPSTTAMEILGDLGFDPERLALVPPSTPELWRRVGRRARRWDYRVVELGGLETAEALESHGRDGWELVAVVGEAGAYRGVLKRRA
jgi:ATP-dependent Clp protease ATP-binding subunit ClpA